jgi:DNA-binding response OmpR family regulator
MAPEGMQVANDATEQHALLLVMADVHIRTIVTRHLRHCGIDVLEAASADEALELNDREYDAVLVDISGPVDGLALMQRIHHLHPHVPVVFSLSYRHLAHDLTKLRKHLPELQTRFDQSELQRRLNASMRRARRPITVEPDLGAA